LLETPAAEELTLPTISSAMVPLNNSPLRMCAITFTPAPDPDTPPAPPSPPPPSHRAAPRRISPDRCTRGGRGAGKGGCCCSWCGCSCDGGCVLGSSCTVMAVARGSRGSNGSSGRRVRRVNRGESEGP